jgi:transcriptional regulator with XRE-family HTH domain
MVIIDTVKTGENIKEIFKENNYKVKDIQKIFGFGTTQAIYKWFRGDSIPSIDNLIIISSICNVSIDNIIIKKYI